MHGANHSFSRKPRAPDREELVLTLRQFVEAETWSESKRILLEHPELLSDEADEVLAGLIASQSSLRGMQLLIQYSDLLARCRSEGIDAAFAPLIQGTAQTGSAPEYPAEFEPEVQRLAALLEGTERHPETYRELVALIRGMLRRLEKGQWPLFRAALLTELGTAYRDSPTGDRETNLAQAVACYREALSVYTLETMPFEYAATQVDLGNAYALLPDDHLPENLEPAIGRRQSNLERAIECYKQALRGFTPETAPHEYAETQINLGNAYVELSTDPATLKRAIACFEEAVRWLNREADPVRHALAQRNLRALRLRLRDALKGRGN